MSKRYRNKSMTLTTLNSRERRSIDAKKHNDLLIENQAYREDRVRDPDKYNRNLNTKHRRKMAATALFIGATISYSETYD